MLVSCICPTRNRREFIPQAIACFQAQTYPYKELIIVDNGESIRDLVPSWATYLYVGEERLSVGEMRNRACMVARGQFIAHWDDDDTSHSARLKEQVKLLRSSNASVVGYNSMVFINEAEKKAWLYRNEEMYALGTSLMYHRNYWRGNKFRDIDVAEDNYFIEAAQRSHSIAVQPAGNRMLARIHPGNTCNKKYMKPMCTQVDYAQACAGIR